MSTVLNSSESESSDGSDDDRVATFGKTRTFGGARAGFGGARAGFGGPRTGFRNGGSHSSASRNLQSFGRYGVRVWFKNFILLYGIR